jgi:hypothetical protein
MGCLMGPAMVRSLAEGYWRQADRTGRLHDDCLADGEKAEVTGANQLGDGVVVVRCGAEEEDRGSRLRFKEVSSAESRW